MGSRRSPANWTERGRLKRSVPGLRDKVYRLHLYRLEALDNDEVAVQGAESRRWREAGSYGNHPNRRLKKKMGCIPHTRWV
jgi:hypothetical protein